MFEIENIQILDYVDTWEHAIRISCEPLLKKGYIEEKYVEKIIENIKKIGFYIVIDEYVAMPHARPEDGVKKMGVSFLKINKGIMFGKQKVYLIFTLASIDASKHIDILQKIMNLLQDENMKNRLIECRDVNEIGGILI